MRISLGHMAVARKVLREVERNIPGRPSWSSSYWLEAYSNGREQGYCIRGFGFVCCFAENRNSDHIVVYVDAKGGYFEMQGNLPTDVAYERAKYFESDEAAKAGAFIAKEITKHADRPRRRKK